MSFDKNKRSSELTMLLLAGYQVLYGKADTGVDRSTSMLIDEQERLLAILMARTGPTPPSGHGHHQVTHQESMPAGDKRHETSESTSKSNSFESSNKESSPDRKDNKQHKTDVKNSQSSDKRSRYVSSKEKENKYDSSDLADDDPSIDEIPEQDLDEDIVDPLSLLG